MSATIALQPANLRGRAAVFNVEDFLALAVGVLLAIGLFTSFPSLASLIKHNPHPLSVPVVETNNIAVEEALPEETTPSENLSPRMRTAMESVSRRYRVSMEAVKPIFEAAQAAGRNLHLDPLLIIAVIGVESRFNPFSESVMGAQGLMQVIPRYHQEKIPEDAGDAPLFDPVTNVQVGALVLKEAISRSGGLIGGLQQFSGAADDPDQRYANKVMAEKQRLEQVVQRNRAGNA